jgi:hypothetical protein
MCVGPCARECQCGGHDGPFGAALRKQALARVDEHIKPVSLPEAAILGHPFVTGRETSTEANHVSY